MSSSSTTPSSKRHRTGMAGLASNLSSRAGSLAQRSTEDSLTPKLSATDQAAPRPVEPTPAALPPAATPTTTAPEGVLQQQPSPSTAAPDGVPAHPQPAPAARPMHGREGRLEASGERIVRWTLELAPQLITALNVWERDETRRVGQRVFRERMVDLALDGVPEDISGILDLVDQLPGSLRSAAGEQFGTRVRSSVRDKLMNLRPELRVAGIKHIRIRDIYSAAVYRHLTALGVQVRPKPI
jgi:hypothetical protein